RGPDEVRRVSQTAKWGPSPTLVQGNTADGWPTKEGEDEGEGQSKGDDRDTLVEKTGHPEDGDRNERMRRRLYLESTCDWMVGSEGLRWGERLLTCMLLVWGWTPRATIRRPFAFQWSKVLQLNDTKTMGTLGGGAEVRRKKLGSHAVSRRNEPAEYVLRMPEVQQHACVPERTQTRGSRDRHRQSERKEQTQRAKD
ncbi:hypothetical protein CABS03_14762, partial [Colletotrichum abscissum]